MPLRKSPRRTRALLAANRRNARKSTGPRTELGKWHSAGNAIRHYRRTCLSSCIPIANREIRAFENFHSKLREAIIPAENAAGTEAVLMNAARAWKVKRLLDRWIETRTEEDWLILAAGAVPPPSFWRLKLRRPGVSVPDWTVTISVWLRWGREPGLSRRSTTEDNERPDRPRMHTMVSVHSTGPRFSDVEPGLVEPGLAPPALSAAEGAEADPKACAERSEGVGPTSTERTKPESDRIQSGSENMSLPADWDPAYAEAYALAERLVGWLMGRGKRTKPECFRKQHSCKNMSPAGKMAGRNPNGGDRAGSLAKVFRAMKAALVPQREGSQLSLFQTKPECKRKESAYKNMSKNPRWLGAAVSFLLKRGSEGGAGEA